MFIQYKRVRKWCAVPLKDPIVILNDVVIKTSNYCFPYLTITIIFNDELILPKKNNIVFELIFAHIVADVPDKKG